MEVVPVPAKKPDVFVRLRPEEATTIRNFISELTTSDIAAILGLHSEHEQVEDADDVLTALFTGLEANGY